MQRLLAHLLLLLYAGAFLHCQVLPVRPDAAGRAAVSGGPSRGVCKKSGPVGQASADETVVAKADPHSPSPALLPADAWVNLYLALRYPARRAALAAAASPALPVADVFANHPNKAPPVRFS
jgi:hypothetical protein